MVKKYEFPIILALQLAICSCGQSSPIPIEEILPKAFQKGTGIMISKATQDEMSVYNVEPFSQEQANRNHYEGRLKTLFRQLRNKTISAEQFKEFTGVNIPEEDLHRLCLENITTQDLEQLLEELEGKWKKEIDVEKLPKLLIMHYTAGTFSSAIHTFTENKPADRTSAHYVFSEEEKDNGISGGTVFSIVREQEAAWHAGVSSWKQWRNLNPYSIGIENVNKGFTQKVDKNSKAYLEWHPFDQAQIVALGKLSQGIIKRYDIHPTNVVGHADIAPTRKQDPGILFPWEVLYAQYQVGAWLGEQERSEGYIQSNFTPKEKLPQDISDSFFLSCLHNYGYNVDPVAGLKLPQNRSTLTAFQAHFSRNQQPEKYGDAINKTDLLWAWGLNAKYKAK